MRLGQLLTQIQNAFVEGKGHKTGNGVEKLRQWRCCVAAEYITVVQGLRMVAEGLFMANEISHFRNFVFKFREL